MIRLATALGVLAISAGSAFAGDPDASSEPVGTLACQLADPIVAYAAFGSPSPLMCDFKPAGAVVVTRMPMRIIAQVEGAPTERGSIAVWKVMGPANADASRLSGEYWMDQDGKLGNGKVALVPAEAAIVPDAMAAMNPAAPGARNVASWIAELRL